MKFKVLGSQYVISMLAVLLVSTSFVSSAAKVEVQIVGDKKTLSDFVVYLEPLFDSNLPQTDKIVEISQRDKSFAPYISVMQLGNQVNFTNQDDITHHIYSPIGKNKFEFKIRSGQSQQKSDFKEAGEVAMGCNIHDWMSGYLLILETPYFDKTDATGHTEISNIAKGQYQLTLWHPQLKTQAHKMLKQIVIGDENAVIKFDVAGLLKAIPKQKSDDDFDFLDEY